MVDGPGRLVGRVQISVTFVRMAALSADGGDGESGVTLLRRAHQKVLLLVVVAGRRRLAAHVDADDDGAWVEWVKLQVVARRDVHAVLSRLDEARILLW